jgi:hopanoid biosynthesis associated protein HpnK
MTHGQLLIVTADDFGLHHDINAAVERAHCQGILNAASLMVSAPAAADAVATRAPATGLRVGLHLVLADGVATLPCDQIPDLVDASGRFGSAMVRDGFRFFFLPRVRAQLAAEIRAQFEAFAATGLPLDHVNAHKHFHLHPTVLSLILSIGRDYGMRAVRLPREAGGPLLLRPGSRCCARACNARALLTTTMCLGCPTRAQWTKPRCWRRSSNCRAAWSRCICIPP